MDMKKLLAVSLTIMILGTLGGCGKQDTQEPPKVEIDYGNSELYTQEDMDAAETGTLEQAGYQAIVLRSEEHTSELQSH